MAHNNHSGGDPLDTCAGCGATLAKEHVHCPSCGAKRVDEPVAPQKLELELHVVLMASIGGMIAFFSFAFWLVAAVAEPGFWTLALGMTVAAIILFLLAYGSRRGQLRSWRSAQERAAEQTRCEYCGMQNPHGIKKCQSCGAPL